ncbi:hypothetical protein NBH00_00915 [Paraconexibacter antarcticus]|uniref:Uncharacterized protein n=1 Tax=Paraconexibacter antarcticus TaxID=2949664 RepID=A0ABY5DV35_9ACTN|nr:hypothetical protein [Paraconexibacter antarcticus]UTI64784.1 hypothetical protein NBH00_00915 [Paraconexibacter antarcticus]
MGSRSRKRGERPAAPPPVPRGNPAPTPPGREAARRHVPGPLDEFSAVAAPAPVAAGPDATQAPAAPPVPGATAPDASAGAPPKKLRGEAANEAIRATLQPLRPGERPRALQSAIALAAFLGLANLVLAVMNVKVGSGTSSRSGGIIFAVIMLGAAWGMWNLRYWAILGFQTLLAITVVIASLAVTVSSNLWALLVCLVVIATFGLQFWKLVRVMARVQMPQRPGR